MLGRLFLLFTVVPVIELYLLISIGKVLGAVATVSIVIVTGFLGAALARREGSRVVRSWQEATRRGEVPKEGVISSLLVLMAGVLLVAPGVITDVLGLLLLVPVVRRRVATGLKGWLERRFRIEAIGGPGMMFDMSTLHSDGGDPTGPAGDVIDATAVEVEHPDADEASPLRSRAPAPASRA